MRDQGIWSLSLGRWSGVYVRLHAFFLLFAVFTLYIGWQSRDPNMPWLGLFCVLVLLISVLVHELGHVCTASRLGGGADEIVIGPLGGLSPIRVPDEPQSELLAICAGPLVNFAICLLSAVFLVLLDQSDVARLLHPLRPEFGFDEAWSLVVALKLTLWINWLLILVNLIPAFPFDGGRALRAGITCLWPSVDSRHVILMVARFAKITAIGLVIAAWWLGSSENQPVMVPTWFALVLLGIFVFFSARVEESRLERGDAADAFLGYDFSQGYTSLERSIEGGSPTTKTEPAGPLVRWLQQRRQQRDRRRQEEEAEEDRRLDEILNRLHQTGLDNLSAEDRKLLERVSERFRSRTRE